MCKRRALLAGAFKIVNIVQFCHSVIVIFITKVEKIQMAGGLVLVTVLLVANIHLFGVGHFAGPDIILGTRTWTESLDLE